MSNEEYKKLVQAAATWWRNASEASYRMAMVAAESAKMLGIEATEAPNYNAAMEAGHYAKKEADRIAGL